MIIVRFTRLDQAGKELFLGSMRAEDLIKVGRVAEWSDGDSDGYQRAPSASRIRNLARFLQSDEAPLLPTSILLSHRGSPLPKQNVSVGVVDIDIAPNESLWIVDGQHRVGGLKYAIEVLGMDELKDFELAVVLMEFDSVTEEAKQFQIVNENMKKVDTSLVRRILQMRLAQGGEGARKELQELNRLWEAAAVEIINSLTKSSESIWYGRIQAPNQSKLSTHVVRELSLTTSLKSILTSEIARDLGPARVGRFIQNYWDAWARVVPEAFTYPTDHVVQKSAGIFILHRVAMHVLQLFMDALQREPTVDEIAEALKLTGEATTAKFWKSNNPEGASLAGSMSGFKLIADAIIETLQDSGFKP